MLDKVRNAGIVVIRRIPRRNSTPKHFIDGDGSTTHRLSTYSNNDL